MLFYASLLRDRYERGALYDSSFEPKAIIVMVAEAGMQKLTEDKCDFVVKTPLGEVPVAHEGRQGKQVASKSRCCGSH